MRPPGKGRVNRAWDRKHLSPHISGQACSNERTTFTRGLDNQYATRETRYDSVASGEVSRKRGRTEVKFRNKQALLRQDAVRECAMTAGVGDVDPCSQDGDGPSGAWRRAQCPGVRGGIDSVCETAHDAPALARQVACKGGRIVSTVCRGVACANDSNRFTLQTGQITLCVKHRWVIGYFLQECRVAWIAQCQQVMVSVLQPGECGINLAPAGLIRCG